MGKNTNFEILTLFPVYFESPLSQSILNRAIKDGLIKVNIFNLRDFAPPPQRTVDDKPYGGGPGMVLKVDVLVKALESISKEAGEKPYVILLDPKGKLYNQKIAERLSKKERILLVCGHYEGVDERFAENWADELISVGDYVLTGGEPAALILADSIARLKTGVLGNIESKELESFSKIETKAGKQVRILDFPVYTRPQIFRAKKVPNVLLSGNHEKIGNWRIQKARELTKKVRPELLTSD